MLLQTIVLAGLVIRLDTTREPSATVRRGRMVVWSGIPKKWKAWKLAGGDIDGNGSPDFAFGIVKQTHIYPRPHKTIFFYEIRGGKVVPKWKGSSLGRPLVDFQYAATARGPRLVALQTLLDGRFSLFVWKWNRFGFRLERSVGSWRSAKLLPPEGSQGTLLANGKLIRVKL